MDDQDIALSITVLHLLRLLNSLLQLAHELDTTLRPDGARTVYTDQNRGNRLSNELQTTVSTRVFNATRLTHAQFNALLE